MKKVSFENGSVKKLFFSFAVPSIIGMLIVSMQMMIDGFFVANTVGAQGLAAINLSMPVVSFVMSTAMMICAGGGVYCSIALGNNQKRKANEIFSFTFAVYLTILGSFSLIGFIFIDEIIKVLGATSSLAVMVKPYLLTMLLLNIFYNFPIFTETFIKIANKPHFVFISCFTCFTGNVIGDYIFIVKLGMGVFGAALATCLADGIAGLILMRQYIKSRSAVSLVKPKGDRNLLGKILYNGSSEMLTVVSSAVATFIFNLILMKRIGEIGVSALTIVFYVNAVVGICLYGLSQALQPIVSYNLGAKRIDKIKEVLRTAFVTGAGIGIFFFIVMKLKSSFVVEIFSKGNIELELLTKEVLNIVVFQYLFSFVNITASSFLTAIEKPLESGIVAFARSLVFTAGFLLTLPLILGNTGLWLALPVGEFFCMTVSIPLMVFSYKKIKNQKQNGYENSNGNKIRGLGSADIGSTERQ